MLTPEVYAEHLDEAAFLWTQREATLASPTENLAHAAAIEERLLAHLDALRIAHPRAVEKFIVPALEAEEAEKILSAAWVIAARAEPEHLDALWSWWDEGAEGQKAGIPRALGLRPPSKELLAGVLKRLRQPDESGQVAAGACEVIRAWDLALDDEDLLPLLQHTEPALVAAALRAIPDSASADVRSIVDRLLTSREPTVRDAAIETGIRLGSRSAWSTLSHAARENGSSLALLLLAVGGEPGDLQQVIEALGEPASRAAALWALGFSGKKAAAEACVGQLRDKKVGHLAFEALRRISGAPTDPGYLAAPIPEDDEPLVPGAEDALPRPDPREVKRWWHANATRFSDAERYLAGTPVTLERIRSALANGPNRDRRVWAQEMTLRAQGLLRLPVEGWAAAQHLQHEALSNLKPAVLARPLRVGLMPHNRQPRTPAPFALPERRPRATGSAPPPAGSLALTALGMASPFGLDALEACAAARAGLRRAQEYAGYSIHDVEHGEMTPVVAHIAEKSLRTDARMLNLLGLAGAALNDVCRGIDARTAAETALVVILPEDGTPPEAGPRKRSSDSELSPYPLSTELERLAERIVPRLVAGAGLAVEPRSVKLIPGQGAALVRALELARAALEARECRTCLLVVADSLVDAAVLDRLEKLGRLKSPGLPAGLMPGEVGLCFRLERPESGRRAQTLAYLETPVVSALAPKGGRALSDAMLRAAGNGAVDEILTPLTGEDPIAYEWGQAVVRVRAKASWSSSPVVHPAMGFGHVGAAAGALAAAMAIHGVQSGDARSRVMAVLADGDERGALCVRGA